MFCWPLPSNIIWFVFPGKCVLVSNGRGLFRFHCSRNSLNFYDLCWSWHVWSMPDLMRNYFVNGTDYRLFLLFIFSQKGAIWLNERHLVGHSIGLKNAMTIQKDHFGIFPREWICSVKGEAIAWLLVSFVYSDESFWIFGEFISRRINGKAIFVLCHLNFSLLLVRVADAWMVHEAERTKKGKCTDHRAT